MSKVLVYDSATSEEVETELLVLKDRFGNKIDRVAVNSDNQIVCVSGEEEYVFDYRKTYGKVEIVKTYIWDDVEYLVDTYENQIKS